MQEHINKRQGHYDFGYRLREDFWGMGFATEGALACLSYSQSVIGLKEIYAMTAVENLASRRVLEKSGFLLEEIFAYDGETTWREPGEPTTWYAYRGTPAS